MKRKLPPLNAAVAFESAARNASFRKAADELCVTASAISHQVRALEDWLGIKLFERSTRVIELTDFGRRYMLELSPLLDRLEKFSNSKSGRRKTQKIITIQTTDSFASRWLIPRLSEFEALHADVVIKIITHNFCDRLRSSEADLGILFITSESPPPQCVSGEPGATSQENGLRLLFAEEIFPVCNPDLIRDIDAISAADLPNFTLIHDDNMGVSWQDWISATAGGRPDKTNMETREGPHYNHAHLALRAAELGNGFTLASNVLAGDALEKGHLIAPFTEKIRTGCGYYFAQSQDAQVREDCLPFAEWIFSRCDLKQPV